MSFYIRRKPKKPQEDDYKTMNIVFGAIATLAAILTIIGYINDWFATDIHKITPETEVQLDLSKVDREEYILNIKDSLNSLFVTNPYERYVLLEKETQFFDEETELTIYMIEASKGNRLIGPLFGTLCSMLLPHKRVASQHRRKEGATIPFESNGIAYYVTIQDINYEIEYVIFRIKRKAM